MISSGLESVLISHPVDSQDNTIGSGVRVAAFRYGTSFVFFLSDLFLQSTLVDFDAIVTLEPIFILNNLSNQLNKGLNNIALYQQQMCYYTTVIVVYWKLSKIFHTKLY